MGGQPDVFKRSPVFTFTKEELENYRDHTMNLIKAGRLELMKNGNEYDRIVEQISKYPKEKKVKEEE